MAGDPVRPHPEDDAGMLDAPVRIEQLGAHRADIRLYGQGRHDLQPVRLDHQDVVIDEGEER